MYVGILVLSIHQLDILDPFLFMGWSVSHKLNYFMDLGLGRDIEKQVT